MVAPSFDEEEQTDILLDSESLVEMAVVEEDFDFV